MTHEEWQHSMFERSLTERLLAGVEEGERAALRKLRCPVDPVAIYAILNEEQPAPWPRKTAALAKARAKHAMFVLALAGKARGHIQQGHENASLAAHAALLVGLYASQATRIEVVAGLEVEQRARLKQERAQRKAQLQQERARHRAQVAQEKSERQARSAASKRKKADVLLEKLEQRRQKTGQSLAAEIRWFLTQDDGWLTATEKERQTKVANLQSRMSDARKRKSGR